MGRTIRQVRILAMAGMFVCALSPGASASTITLDGFGRLTEIHNLLIGGTAYDVTFDSAAPYDTTFNSPTLAAMAVTTIDGFLNGLPTVQHLLADVNGTGLYGFWVNAGAPPFGFGSSYVSYGPDIDGIWDARGLSGYGINGDGSPLAAAQAVFDEVVPEPGTLFSMLGGVGMLGFAAWKRRTRSGRNTFRA